MATELLFPADHPATLGHFPGNPIIPGAVLLDGAIRSIATAVDASVSPCRVRSAKFFAPVRPGDRVTIDFSRTPAGGIRFTCAVDGEAVLRGEASCGSVPTAS